MRLRKTEASSPWFDQIMDINREAFPVDERLNEEDFLKLKDEAGAEIIAFCKKEEAVAFAVTMSEGCLTYILHFAVRADLRGQGIGAQAIEAMKARYVGNSLCLDFEPPDPMSNNAEQRERRKDFYLRCGFRSTDVRTSLRGNVFDVVRMGEPFSTEDLSKIVERIHHVEPAFGSRLIRA